MTAALIEATHASFTEWAKEVPDPRLASRVVYPLMEILFVLFIGQLCGMGDIDETVLFANMELGWFRGVMPFEAGIAPAQTIRRVLSALDNKAFGSLFTAWAAQWRGHGVVAIDGKCLRGASEKGTRSALYTVSAFAHRAGLVLGQQKVHDKSNEITAIPALLKQLVLTGNTVTIDAMGTQSAIAAAIRAKDAHYILALKGNQSSLHEDVARFFEDKALSQTCATFKTTDAGHGRIEERTIRATGGIDWLREMHPQWKDLCSIIAITSVRRHKKTGQTSTETRYYIASLPADPRQLLDAVRSHWSIESFHWSLDVTFGEDKSRLRKDNAAANMAIIRKAVFNTLRQDPSDKQGPKKMSLKLKRLKAAHDPVYRSLLINRS